MGSSHGVERLLLAPLDQLAGLETMCLAAHLNPCVSARLPCVPSCPRVLWKASLATAAAAAQRPAFGRVWLLALYSIPLLHTSPEEGDSAQAQGCGGVQTGVKKLWYESFVPKRRGRSTAVWLQH